MTETALQDQRDRDRVARFLGLTKKDQEFAEKLIAEIEEKERKKRVNARKRRAAQTRGQRRS